ncbi:sigma-70 family RNA polymerase sigma factor [Terrabacter terrigena]|uniref:Sigma-70 family RNA polymerase sigma factor n=1 Tax=Terrabacter terrigena TaxID=574718 RepID=A0ABW3MZ52_9MICO
MSADATLWSSEAWASAPDATLLARSRDGSAEAFGELWRRHLPAAYAVANRHRGRSAPEDVVAEAAARVLGLIREGRGPHENFRAYFLSAVRTVAIDQGRRELRLVPTEDDDLEGLAPALPDLLAGLAVDEEGLALVRTAFAGLPERDQRILWHTTVEGAAPRNVAPALGMTANAVSARAMRAREALRANYLDARAARELAGADSDECRWTVTHLGAFVRGRLPKRQTERAQAHVAGCPHAAALAADLRVIHDGFPALVVPVVLAAGLATPGFVTGGVVAALSAATSAASTTAFTTAASTSGAVGSSGATCAPRGLESVAGRAAEAVAQVAGRATSLGAVFAVTAGLAGALAVPGPSLTGSGLPAPQARPSSSATAPAPAAAPSAFGRAVPATPIGTAAAAAPSAIASTVGAGVVRPVTGTPRPAASSQQPVGVGATGGATVGASPGPVAAGPPRPVAPTAQAPEPSRPSMPADPSTPGPVRPSSSTPSPAPNTPVTAPGPPTQQDPSPDPEAAAPTIRVRLVRAGDTARISVRVRTESATALTVRITNLSGAGRLTVRNSSWDCTQPGRATVSCTGARGSAVLEQAGTGGVVPLVVRVTDSTGGTWTQTLRPT